MFGCSNRTFISQSRRYVTVRLIASACLLLLLFTRCSNTFFWCCVVWFTRFYSQTKQQNKTKQNADESSRMWSTQRTSEWLAAVCNESFAPAAVKSGVNEFVKLFTDYSVDGKRVWSLDIASELQSGSLKLSNGAARAYIGRRLSQLRGDVYSISLRDKLLSSATAAAAADSQFACIKPCPDRLAQLQAAAPQSVWSELLTLLTPSTTTK